jgi:hypothetical protein
MRKLEPQQRCIVLDSPHMGQTMALCLCCGPSPAVRWRRVWGTSYPDNARFHGSVPARPHAVAACAAHSRHAPRRGRATDVPRTSAARASCMRSASPRAVQS